MMGRPKALTGTAGIASKKRIEEAGKKKSKKPKQTGRPKPLNGTAGLRKK